MEGTGCGHLPTKCLTFIIIGFFILHGAESLHQPFISNKCSDDCIFTIVQSIPDNLTYPASAPIMLSTFKAHKRLLEKAKSTIHLATFYWSLTERDMPCPDHSSAEGEDIFETLLGIVKGGNIDMKIVQNITNNDTYILQSFGAEVRTLDLTHLVGAGVMHTKMWIIDGQHMYIGSGNMDWRSYTQTAEIGVLIENCPCLGSDAEKLFEVYRYLAVENSTIPKPWPAEYGTAINKTSPILVHYNDTKAPVYLSSSPPQLCPPGRTTDTDAVLDVIGKAQKYIYISVMDYIPMVIYTGSGIFWPVIDDALRHAAIDRQISVCLMTSKWKHSLKDALPFLHSLNDLKNTTFHKIPIQLKLFSVPSYTPAQRKIPFARVNHNKYMVTDQHAYIGTSNWAGDYFKSTAGVGFILEQPGSSQFTGTNLRDQLQQIFERDWNSEYAMDL